MNFVAVARGEVCREGNFACGFVSTTLGLFAIAIRQTEMKMMGDINRWFQASRPSKQLAWANSLLFN